MKIGHIKQIILYVENMENQVKFYRETLGLTIGFPILEDYSNETWVSFNTGECTLALHAGGKGRIGEDAAKFTFEVDDVPEIVSALNEKGVKTSVIIEPYPGSFVVHAKDPENNAFSVQSHPKGK